jgi:hypothetical protein
MYTFLLKIKNRHIAGNLINHLFKDPTKDPVPPPTLMTSYPALSNSLQALKLLPPDWQII